MSLGMRIFLILLTMATLAAQPPAAAARITTNGQVGERLPADATASTLAALSATRAIVIDRPMSVDRSMTLPSLVTFADGGRLTIAAGATVTFGQQPSAPDIQIFYGLGAVAGLKLSKAIWFAGTILNSDADALPPLQRTIDAAVSGGTVDIPPGYFLISGRTALSVTRGQRIQCAGKFKSTIYYSSAATNAVAFSGAVGGALVGCTFGLQSYAVLPTSGAAITITAPYTTIDQVLVRGSNVGIDASGAPGIRILSPDLFDSQSSGLYVHDINDLFVDHALISAPVDRMTIADASGTFADGDRLVGQSSGATATIRTVIPARGPTALRTEVHAATNFTAGETVKDTTTGATFTMTAQIPPHQLGGIRLRDKVEAVVVSVGDVIGGKYSLRTEAANYAPNARPAYNRFVAVYFDSADEGVELDNVIEFDFIGSWFSNRPGNGIRLLRVDGVRFTGGGAINSAKNGAVISKDAKFVSFNAFAARGNGTLAPGRYAGIEAEPGATDFSITNSTLGGTLGFGSQGYGVRVRKGSSDRYIVTGNLVSGNATAGVEDGGTGASKTVASNH